MDDPDFELADIAEQAEIVGKLSPREYAKLRGTTPQSIYYHIRNKTIELEYCVCGRRVVDVAKADASLQEKARQRGKELDTRSDADREQGQGDAVQELPAANPLEGLTD